MGASLRNEARVVVGLALAGAAAIVGALVAGAVGACIPDLHVTELPGPPPPPLCGNGFVDLDAGEQCDPGEAGAPGCTATCRIDCNDGGGFVDPTSGHCYFYYVPQVGTPPNYANGAAGCILANAHLVTFASPDELGVVAGWNAGQTDASFWVGLQTIPNAGWISASDDEPGFTPGCTGCYAASDDAGNFPQPRDAGSPCLQVASASPQAVWQKIPCSDSRRIVCEQEPAGSLSQECGGGFCIALRKTLGKKRYIYINTPLPADDAKTYCHQFASGHLVMLDSREEREQLWAELAGIDPTLKQIWIGLARDGDGGASWLWDDGAPIDGGRPVPWGNVQPAVLLDAGAPRAYIERLARTVDSQLARSIDRSGNPTPTELPFVCQFVDVPDAGK